MVPGQNEWRILEAGSTFLAVGVGVSPFFLWDFASPWLPFLKKLLAPQGHREHDRENPRVGDRSMGPATVNWEKASKFQAS